MQTARPIIAEDLGPDVAKGAVSTEGVRRWNAMAAQDKQVKASPLFDPPGFPFFRDTVIPFTAS